MSTNYIGINGLVTQSLNDIIADLKTKFQTIYGDDINLEQNTPDGQWINILAQEKKDLLDLVTQIVNNLDPDTVIGLPQQILYKLNGLVIKAYTYSYVYVNVNVSQSTTLQGLDEKLESADGTGYTATDTNGNRWILTNTVNLNPGEHLLNFRAAELGSVTSLANTITIMETIQAGIISVNNPSNNYITGNTGETTAEFRQRRDKVLAAPSQGFDESLQGQLLNLDNVTQAVVYDNRSNITVNNIPPHTVWAIVEGGSAQDIGYTIYNNVPPGIPMKGEESFEIVKETGKIETVYWDVPNPVQLYIRATLQNFTTVPFDLSYLSEQISLITYNIGQKAETANLTSSIKDLLGEAGSVYNVEISLDGEEWAEVLTPEGLDEFFAINPSDITLTVEGENG